MTEKAFNNWYSMSDQALAGQIGAFVKHHRLEQNKTQEVLSYEAGISRSTLSLLERGETIHLATLLRVLRVLGQLQVMEAFEIRQLISPLALAESERAMRKRARNNAAPDPEKSDW